MAQELTAKQKESRDEKAASVIKRFESMRGSRGNLESQCQEISERVWPSQSRLFGSRNESGTEGEKRSEQVYDSTASTALNRFTAILDTLLTPMNQTWHYIKPSDPYLMKDRDTVLWFEEVNRLLFKLRYAPNSNFISQNQLVYKMLGAYGTGSMYVDPYYDKKTPAGFRYKNIHLAEIYFDENHQGIIDTAVRHFKMKGRQLLQKWPNAIPEATKKQIQEKPEKDFFVLHCVMPNEDYQPERKDHKGMDFESTYVLVEGKALLSEGGYRVFPYPTSRFEQVPGEIYGRSPAMDLLPNIKTLNEMKKTILKQGHRTVDPVLIVHDDGVMDGFNLTPGAVNMGGVNAEGRALVHTLPVGNIAVGKDLMDDEKAAINDANLVSLFQILVENPRMTATEVMERLKERNILLAPTVGRQYSEYHGPLITRELDILQQLKTWDGRPLLPPIPKMLAEAGGEYRVEYESPMARGQRAEEASGLMRVVETALNIATQAQDPTPLDHFDWDAIMPDIADIHGLPEKWRNSKEKIQKIRAGRQKAAEEQKNIEAAPGAAAMVNAETKSRQK